jgi:hypothetical protein
MPPGRTQLFDSWCVAMWRAGRGESPLLLRTSRRMAVSMTRGGSNLSHPTNGATRAKPSPSDSHPFVVEVTATARSAATRSDPRTWQLVPRRRRLPVFRYALTHHQPVPWLREQRPARPSAAFHGNALGTIDVRISPVRGRLLTSDRGALAWRGTTTRPRVGPAARGSSPR